MNWSVTYLPEALDDLKALDGSQRLLVRKAIAKVSKNPLPDYQNGYGKPLGNKSGTHLSGFLKIKLLSSGLRIVYKLIHTDDSMLIVIIGTRADEEVYEIAQKRIAKNKL